MDVAGCPTGDGLSEVLAKCDRCTDVRYRSGFKYVVGRKWDDG
jgi:hypothetical protein